MGDGCEATNLEETELTFLTKVTEKANRRIQLVISWICSKAGRCFKELHTEPSERTEQTVHRPFPEHDDAD